MKIYPRSSVSHGAGMSASEMRTYVFDNILHAAQLLRVTYRREGNKVRLRAS